MNVHREGILFVISAPSGTGKTSLSKELIDFFPQLRHSVSFTTRPMRSGEVNGRDYHFVSREDFDAMVEREAFAEWAEVHGNRYGTSLKTLEEARRAGYDLLLDIDCQGAAQIRRSCEHGVFIFILPPSFDELERRLQGRNTDTAEVIARRIANARKEVLEAPWYDYVVVNEEFSRASADLKAILQAEGCRTARVLPQIAKIFDIQINRDN